MANLLEWTFKLNDKVSTPAKSAAGGLSEFVQTAHSALAVTQMVGQAILSVGNSAASAFGAMVTPAITMEKTLGSFETLLGSAQKATEMYDSAVKFAAETPFQTPEVVKGFQSLLTAHMKPVEVPIAMTIIGDAASMQQDSAAALNTVTAQLGQMRALGKMTMEDLKPIAQATNMDLQKLYGNLATLYGTSVAQVKTMAGKGAIDADAATFAILQTMQQQFGGNMQKASKQVGGLWSTITSYPEQYLEQIERTEGYEKMRGALKNIADVFDPVNGKGKELLATVKEFGGGLLDRLFGGLSGEDGARNTEDILATMKDLLEDVEAGVFGLVDGFNAGFGAVNQMDQGISDHKTTMENFRVTMESIGLSLGVVAGAIKTVSGALSTMFGWFESIGEWTVEHPALFRMMTATVGAVGGGLAGGAAGLATMGPAGALLGALGGAAAGGVAGGFAPEIIEGMAGATVDNTTGTSAGTTQDVLLAVDRLRAHEALNREEGMALAMMQIPHYASGGMVTSPTVALIGEAGPEMVVPLSGKRGDPWSEVPGFGGSSPSIGQVNFEYHAGSGGSDGDRKQEAQDIQRLVESGILQALNRWQLQAGR